jgi:hypothetical protein
VRKEEDKWGEREKKLREREREKWGKKNVEKVKKLHRE